MALPSNADFCRRCGGRLKKGFIMGEGDFATATIVWVPASPADGVNSSVPNEPATELAPLPFTRLAKEPEFPARICTHCRLVEFEYP